MPPTAVASRRGSVAAASSCGSDCRTSGSSRLISRRRTGAIATSRPTTATAPSSTSSTSPLGTRDSRAVDTPLAQPTTSSSSTVAATVATWLTATLAAAAPTVMPARWRYRMLRPTWPTVGGVTSVSHAVDSCTSVVRTRGSAIGTNGIRARAAPT